MRTPALILAALSLGLSACGGGNAANTATNAPPPGNARDDDAERQRKARADQARDAIERARRLHGEGKLAEAITEAELASEIDPGNGLAFAWLGEAYTEQGRDLEAARAHREAARLAPNERERTQQTYRAGDASRRVAKKAFANAQYKMAAEHARDALKANQLDAEARRVLADALLQAGLHAESRPEYQRLADEGTGKARQEALYWVGICGLYLFEYAQAEKVFDALVKEGYQAGDIYLWRGRCRFERKDVEGAKQDFRLAVEFASTPDQRKVCEAALAELEQPGKQE